MAKEASWNVKDAVDSDLIRFPEGGPLFHRHVDRSDSGSFLIKIGAISVAGETDIMFLFVFSIGPDLRGRAFSIADFTYSVLDELIWQKLKF